MKTNNKEKGSILLMSAVLLAVVMMIGTMIIAVFFRGYINVSREIVYFKEKLAIQVEAQDYYVSLSEDIDINDLPEGLTYDMDLSQFRFEIENERFKVIVILDLDLNIVRWIVRE